MSITRPAATLGIIFFVALALIIYFFDRPIVPEPIDCDLNCTRAGEPNREVHSHLRQREHAEKGLCELSKQLLEEHG